MVVESPFASPCESPLTSPLLGMGPTERRHGGDDVDTVSSDNDVDGAPQRSCSVGCVPFGTLILRAADGIARNIVFANQIDVLQRYAGLGQNGAQQQAKFVSALCCSTPLAVGFLTRKLKLPLPAVVLTGCVLELLGCLVLAAVAGGMLGPGAVLVGLMALYSSGYGSMTSALPVLGLSEVSASQRASFSQYFFAVLSAGSIVGIFLAGGAQVLNLYLEAFLLGAVLLCLGTAAFLLRRQPPVQRAPEGVPEAKVESDSESETESMVPSSTDAPNPRVRMRSLRFLAALVPFYAAYLQWSTSWYVQALAMNRWVLGVEAPACLLQAVERLSALALNLALARAFRDRAEEMSLEVRVAAGCLLAALALITSGVVELVRRDASRMGDAEVSSLSVGWLVPQYSLIAFAEAIIFPAQNEWAAGRPDLIGLAVLTQAAAAFALGLLLPHLGFWLPQDSINNGHYDRFFFVLAAGCMLSAVALLQWRPRPGANSRQ